MLGSINVRPDALRLLQQHVEVLGPVPRSTVREHYAWADVFLLPSLCEGSATVTYEALACGLPVIATPNTGSIVREGVDGFIVPIRDPEAIAAKLELFISQPDLLATMACHCREGAREGTLASYARRLNRALDRLPTESNPS
jgi:glycosyltransferase involved in cell wall biosynthesis